MLKNNKAFTPPFLKSYLSLERAGFTYLELIIATMILSIAVAGVFAAFLSSARFSGAFRHDVMAAISAQGYLEQARATSTFTTVDTVAAPDISTWPLKGEVSNLSVPSPTVSNINLGCTNPAYNFKRVTVTVNWNERQI